MIYLVHHGEAVPSSVDAQRPLTDAGRAAVERLAREAAGRAASRRSRSGTAASCGRARPAKRSAWRATRWPPSRWCAACSRRTRRTFSRIGLAGETRDLLLVGHMPHIARLLRRLLGRVGDDVEFPPHGMVALEPDPGGDPTRWRQVWSFH